MRISHPHWALLMIFLAVIGNTVTSAFPLDALPHARLAALGTFPIEAVSLRNSKMSLSHSLCSIGSRTTKTEQEAPTSMPPRKAKHRAARKKNPQRDISPQELAHHVAHKYLHGSGGVLRENSAKSEQRNEKTSFMRKLDRHPALLLNADYQPMNKLPLSLLHWQEAVKAIFSGKVTVVETYPDVMIRAASLELPLPSVIALNVYVPQFDQVRIQNVREYLDDTRTCLSHILETATCLYETQRLLARRIPLSVLQ
jgi:hypothetical protein